MISRRRLLQGGAVSAASLASGSFPAAAENTPGVTATEIKIGQTMPYSGPASAYGVIGRTEAAYFKMINDMGGVNGRRLNLISVDDGYSPPRTVEQTRRLVEQEGVAFMFNSLGSATNLAVRDYLNENKVPQLFIATGSSTFSDPRHYPWTIPFNVSFKTEGRVVARYFLKTNPDAKIGLLYENDSDGMEFSLGLREALGSDHAAMLVKEVSYEVSDPTVDSQVVTLQGAGADTLVIAASPKFAAQAIRKAYDIGWRPERYLGDASVSIAATLKPAGLDKSKGIISTVWGKDPADPRWKDDPGYKEYAAFITKCMTPAQLTDFFSDYGFSVAHLLVHVLRQCGDDFSRANIMRQATNIKDYEPPMALPGMKFGGSANDYNLVQQMQFMRFDGERWEMFGDLVSG